MIFSKYTPEKPEETQASNTDMMPTNFPDVETFALSGATVVPEEEPCGIYVKCKSFYCMLLLFDFI